LNVYGKPFFLFNTFLPFGLIILLQALKTWNVSIWVFAPYVHNQKEYNPFENADCVFLKDNLGTNTYSSALLVGEKGADLLAEDLGTFSFHQLSFSQRTYPFAFRPQTQAPSRARSSRSCSKRCSRYSTSSLNGFLLPDVVLDILSHMFFFILPPKISLFLEIWRKTEIFFHAFQSFLYVRCCGWCEFMRLAFMHVFVVLFFEIWQFWLSKYRLSAGVSKTILLHAKKLHLLHFTTFYSQHQLRYWQILAG
jgi:hypothetical protein